MGRMWHSLLLGQWKEMFLWLPIEELIQSRQNDYYDTLGKADKAADSTVFVELMLEIIRDTLQSITVIGHSIDPKTDQDNVFISRLLTALGNDTVSAATLMERLSLSHKPTFRKNYLQPSLDAGVIERTIPDKPNSKNQRYRKTRR